MKNEQQHVFGALRWASSFLQQYDREPKVAELLLMHHLRMTKSELLGAMRDPLTSGQYGAFKQDVFAHVKTGIPVQHIIGQESFFGRKFIVNKDVLIPRPETEELIIGVLAFIDKLSDEDHDKPISIVDVGTGSGVIATTIKLERPGVDMWATDISEAALTVAKQNAEQLQADVTFLRGDFLAPIVEANKAFDMIVSNPPYIAYRDKSTLQDTVKNFDPELALFADENGLAAYSAILANVSKVITKNAFLAFEIGYQQGEQVRTLIEKQFPTCNREIEVRKDVNGKDRMVFAKLSSSS